MLVDHLLPQITQDPAFVLLGYPPGYNVGRTIAIPVAFVAPLQAGNIFRALFDIVVMLDSSISSCFLDQSTRSLVSEILNRNL